MAAATGSGGSAAWANVRYQIINRGTGTALDGMGNTTAGSTASM
ncbi:hypothetical protein [Catelliglobosispora koreensis]|nr:hypothetical protein [Catelliglobosispora koreensis]